MSEGCGRWSEVVGSLLTFAESAVAIINEHTILLPGGTMGPDSSRMFKFVKLVATALGVLMLAGVATAMVLARGKGEDLTGVVAPALFITVVLLVVASVAGVLLRRAVTDSHRAN